ncbi:MAG: hypothetical protein V4772_22605 [Pseudomonadota bacterium]
MTSKPIKLLSAALLLACASLQAHAVGRLADITVVDRDSGITLPVHFYRGEYWVAGKPGARYAVAVRNKTGERLLTVPSVDGVNVLSGETASWDQTGYVFSPYEKYNITGWRKSNSEVAAFEFSAASDSYAGLTGRPGHVGVIGVALFRERLPEPVAITPYEQPRRQRFEGEASGRLRNAPAPAAADSAAPAATARAESAEQAQRAPAGKGSLEKAAPYPSSPMPAPKLGTAHGQRESSVVSHTSFERLQPQPNEIIRIRYDSRENLVASGVIREPVANPQAVPNPFPQSPNTAYVPDPPLRRY